LSTLPTGALNCCFFPSDMMFPHSIDLNPSCSFWGLTAKVMTVAMDVSSAVSKGEISHYPRCSHHQWLVLEAITLPPIIVISSTPSLL
ncbi:MAG: hypothetical protein WBG66_09240, partial [Geitlerinemataceae cyanobacterium]